MLTSDRPPKDMSRLDERLRTRFEWGLIADIQPPDIETRTAIISNKAAAIALDLSDAVISFIAENITANVRQLEGVVKKLLAYSLLLGKKIDIDTASAAIGDVFTENPAPTPESIYCGNREVFRAGGGVACVQKAGSADCARTARRGLPHPHHDKAQPARDRPRA